MQYGWQAAGQDVIFARFFGKKGRNHSLDLFPAAHGRVRRSYFKKLLVVWVVDCCGACSDGAKNIHFVSEQLIEAGVSPDAAARSQADKTLFCLQNVVRYSACTQKR